MRSLCNITDVGGWRLKSDSIERVERVENNTTKAAQYKGQYTERATAYMIKLKGENRLRRVYATPIGNVSVMYFKVYNRAVSSGVIYCETALDEALNRAVDD
jgi:hypothetical protein